MNNKNLSPLFEKKATYSLGLTLIILLIIFAGCGEDNAQIDPDYRMDIKKFELVTFKSANIIVDFQFENTDIIEACGVCLSPTTKPDITCSTFYMPWIKNGEGTINTYGLEPKTTYYVRAFAKDKSGIYHYGVESKFNTAELPPKPNNVDYFTIDVSRQKMLISGIYIPLMKQFKLTVQEYSKVEYKWSCSDKSVQGIVVSTRPFTPEDGYPFSNYNTQTFVPSGSKLFPKWDGLPGYLQLYIRTYNSKYYYSTDYLMVQKMIEATRTYEIWSDKPYL